MSKFKKWLLTSPISDDDFFFTNIRELARAIHLWRGHKWVERSAWAEINGEKISEIKFRTCVDCETKEMTNEKGEWVARNEK